MGRFIITIACALLIAGVLAYWSTSGHQSKVGEVLTKADIVKGDLHAYTLQVYIGTERPLSIQVEENTYEEIHIGDVLEDIQIVHINK